MKIRFETTMDDLIAFNKFHFANSPAWRRQVWIQSLFVPALCVVAAIFLINSLVWQPPGGLSRASIIGVLAAGAMLPVISGCWILYVRWYMKRALNRSTRKFLAEGSNRTLVGWREMGLSDGRLQINTAYQKCELDLHAIDKIVSNDDYAFVYVSAFSAYLIPIGSDESGDFREFVAELEHAWEDRGIFVPWQASELKDVDERIVER